VWVFDAHQVSHLAHSVIHGNFSMLTVFITSSVINRLGLARWLGSIKDTTTSRPAETLREVRTHPPPTYAPTFKSHLSTCRPVDDARLISCCPMFAQKTQLPPIQHLARDEERSPIGYALRGFEHILHRYGRASAGGACVLRRRSYYTIKVVMQCRGPYGPKS
jgi:hypothetical protein